MTTQWWPTPKPALLAAITVLRDAFGDGSNVSSDLPKRNPPDQFLHLERVGGRQDNPAIDVARILVSCFAKGVGQAENMANVSRAALRNASGRTITCETDDGEVDVFIRGWGAEQGPSGNNPHPDFLEFERWQVHGDLIVKSN